ncbi:LytTR family DNA-binding domain-containing protein [Octadecabacter temperatus]|nr:LytTR family DNA-binding domain-containing protein [Octadecabacter temperatus]
MAQPARLAGLLGASVVLTLMGPFNTSEVMRVAPRLAYWAAVVFSCYTIGYFANQIGGHLAGPRAGFAKRLIFCGGLTALGVLAAVYVLTGLAIGYWAVGRDLLLLSANVIAISSIITAVFLLIDDSETAPESAALPVILDRLPFDKRGALVSLSVEDHYVRIRTTNGEDMVLLRLADAMREVGDTTGLQVHRSHWIALDQVTAAARKGDGAILSMASGPDIPVSRANISSIKEAGLLPRT